MHADQRDQLVNDALARARLHITAATEALAAARGWLTQVQPTRFEADAQFVTATIDLERVWEQVTHAIPERLAALPQPIPADPPPG